MFCSSQTKMSEFACRHRTKCQMTQIYYCCCRHCYCTVAAIAAAATAAPFLPRHKNFHLYMYHLLFDIFVCVRGTIRYWLFCDITHFSLVVSCRCFETTYRSSIQRRSSFPRGRSLKVRKYY